MCTPRLDCRWPVNAKSMFEANVFMISRWIGKRSFNRHKEEDGKSQC